MLDNKKKVPRNDSAYSFRGFFLRGSHNSQYVWKFFHLCETLDHRQCSFMLIFLEQGHEVTKIVSSTNYLFTKYSSYHTRKV